MKFDPSKPHGLVYGDHGATYEQNGNLFDAGGRLIDAPEEPEPEVEPGEATSPIEDFLRAQLSGGPVAQSNIYKEAQNANLIFSDVKAKAAEMGVQIATINKIMSWKL